MSLARMYLEIFSGGGPASSASAGAGIDNAAKANKANENLENIFIGRSLRDRRLVREEKGEGHAKRYRGCADQLQVPHAAVFEGVNELCARSLLRARAR